MQPQGRLNKAALCIFSRAFSGTFITGIEQYY
jgi:hypothetical protein